MFLTDFIAINIARLIFFLDRYEELFIMKKTMNLVIVFCYLILGRLVVAKFAVKVYKKEVDPEAVFNSLYIMDDPYKKNRKYSETDLKTAVENVLSSTITFRPAFIQDDRDAHPQPLPTDPPPKKIAMSPYTTLYQGIRSKDDKRVFRKQFDYPAILDGQRVVCQGLLDCVITHIAIESTEAIPVLLRGGAGYRHFTAIIKSKPHHALKGQVRAYCKKDQVPPVDDKKIHRTRRRFNFGDQLAEENWT